MLSRTLLAVLVTAVTAHSAEPAFLDAAFHGEIRALRGRTVTLYYDFETPDQLEDFEVVVPKGLFKDATLKAKSSDGQLVLRGRGAFVHKMFGVRLLGARFLLRVEHRADLGTLLLPPDDGPYVLADFFDRRFKEEGGLYLAACTPGTDEPLLWREIANAPPVEVRKRFPPEEAVEIEVAKRGVEEFLRIGTLVRNRSSLGKALRMSEMRFGWWLQNGEMIVDDLEITLELSDAYLDRAHLTAALSGDAALRGWKDGKLGKVMQDYPLSAEAMAARRALGLRGEKGWEKLASVVKRLLRKKAYAAVPVIETIAGGPEQERRAILEALYKKRNPPEVNLAILRGLLRWYPENAELIHGGLSLPIPQRVELLRDLVHHGAPDEIVKRAVEDELLAEEAYEILRDRGARPDAAGISNLARLHALEAISPIAARAILREFSEAPNWKLVNALLPLLSDDDAKVALGAQLLMLTLSGKDIAADADLWGSWISAKKDNYEPPGHASPGIVAAAILRGVDFLKRDLAADGFCTWPFHPEWGPTRIGATALAVYALRSSGVKRDDPVLLKAVKETLLSVRPNGVAGLRDMKRYTYALSTLALALRSLHPTEYKPLLDIIAKKLVEGQLANGQWTYYCKDPYSKKPPRGDNSNTQYAVLALRAARRSGVVISAEVWTRNAQFWRKSMNARGGWGYGTASFDHEFSMTSAGVATLAICAEALHGDDAARGIKDDKRVGAGMIRLGELLLKNGYDDQEIYAYYGVERASILTGTKFFEDYDWYADGAAILVRRQKESGAWGDANAQGVTTGEGYGEAIDTAYALLFLKRATTGLAGAEGDNVIRVPGAAAIKARRARREKKKEKRRR